MTTEALPVRKNLLPEIGNFRETVRFVLTSIDRRQPELIPANEEAPAETEPGSKKRILFIPMSWGRGMGPLMDCLAVAEELQSMGHETAFISRDRFAPITQAQNYPTYPIISPEAPKTLTPLFDTDFPLFQGLGDEELVRQTLKDEQKAIKDFQPDIIFSWLQQTAFISSQVTGIPLASVARWTGHPDFTSDLLPGKKFPISGCTPLFNKLLTENNLPEIDDIWELDFFRSDLKIVPGIQELEPGFSKKEHGYYVGYLSASGLKQEKLSDELTTWLNDKPIIFVYLSVKQFQPEKYIPILQEAFNNSEFKVLVAMGLEDIAPELPPSDNSMRFENFVPIDSILPHAKILMSAGTRGMSWQAALNGVAHICFPGTDPERDFVSQMVEKAKAGVKLTDDAFTPEALLQNARNIMNSNMQKEAAKLGERLQVLGGAQKAAELIIDHAS